MLTVHTLNDRICARSNNAAHGTAPNLCWYWADPYGNAGYWDYC